MALLRGQTTFMRKAWELGRVLRPAARNQPRTTRYGRCAMATQSQSKGKGKGKNKNSIKTSSNAKTEAQHTKVKLPGAYYNKQRNHWMSRIMVQGKLMYLGSFETAQEAHEAYMAAKSFYDPKEAEKLTTRMKNVRKFKGVTYDKESGKFETVLLYNEDTEISGGMYDNAEEAAKAYDALARMYFGPGAEVNYPSEETTSTWVPPESSTRPLRIPVRKGERLTVNEIIDALEAERGQDIRWYELKESGLGDYLICVTGRSVGHMRKMGDLLVKALHDRELQAPYEVGQWAVEGRDMDDWMVVDCGNVLVSIFEEESRQSIGLDDLYDDTVEDTELDTIDEDEIDRKDGDNDETVSEKRFQKWLKKHTLPEKWEEKLDRDAEVIENSRIPSSR